MLKLTRNVGETFNIGNDVQITVLDVKGKMVRIGVIAPREIPVYREEIYERIKKENGNRITVPLATGGLGGNGIQHVRYVMGRRRLRPDYNHR